MTVIQALGDGRYKVMPGSYGLAVRQLDGTEQVADPGTIVQFDNSRYEVPDGISDLLAQAFLAAIIAERLRAHDKHGRTSMEQAPLLAHKRASVLVEEAVECAKALNDREHGDIELSERLNTRNVVEDDLDKELIQTAAMAYTWWANRRGEQLRPWKPKPSLPADVYDLLEHIATNERFVDLFGGGIDHTDPQDVVARARDLLEHVAQITTTSTKEL